MIVSRVSLMYHCKILRHSYEAYINLWLAVKHLLLVSHALSVIYIKRLYPLFYWLIVIMRDACWRELSASL
jgi:hypothetical protein